MLAAERETASLIKNKNPGPPWILPPGDHLRRASEQAAAPLFP